MEKAIHITNLENLKYWKPLYKRLYWGVEFCQNLIPVIEETERILQFARDKNISTTRFCPMETRFQKIYRIGVCCKECQRMYDKLRNRGISKLIYKRGNTTFYKNPVRLREIDSLGIDRRVYQPQLPF